MKYILLVILSVFLLVGLTACGKESSSTSLSCARPGDVNRDGLVDHRDARLLYQQVRYGHR